MSRAGLSKRQKKQYLRILAGKAGDEYWYSPHWKSGASRQPAANAVAAYTFLKNFGRRLGVDVARMVGIIAKDGPPEVLHRTAMDLRHLPINIRRIERAMLEANVPRELRRFARNVPGARSKLLEDLTTCAEVLAL